MILKDKQLINAQSPTAKAGQQQEQDVAFYLRRAFKDHPKIFVINDFSFTHNGEQAQIDHLIVYPYGLILIESKSISGEVKVNQQGEWTRTLGKKWVGMPSPVKQVELQQTLLADYLHEHREQILPKLLGFKQQSFRFRQWHCLCAVSSNSVIERDSMPKDISAQIVKSEFLVDKLNKLMDLRSKVLSTLTFDTRPDFRDNELKSITDFLLSEEVPKLNTVAETSAQTYEISDSETNEQPKVAEPKSQTVNSVILACKKCGNTEKLKAHAGRYGYYVHCDKCDTNTAMKLPCPQCSSKQTKVAKRQTTYTLNCQACYSSALLMDTSAEAVC
ncbi:NERD domain-containing protein [Thalassotalea euphylliae]|uniref:NERD domain-containing protein n=1 Tax=Thalassotalea euphylliae TaxID=1655234 RepID=A0A3E0TP83_9GAMM|nr:nuclease-related domain-containing protein [Thalassotalea euphylliae]REL26334.1 NERD domain-containing protein [Thalassotalea euphylliae]